MSSTFAHMRTYDAQYYQNTNSKKEEECFSLSYFILFFLPHNLLDYARPITPVTLNMNMAMPSWLVSVIFSNFTLIPSHYSDYL